MNKLSFIAGIGSFLLVVACGNDHTDKYHLKLLNKRILDSLNISDTFLYYNSYEGSNRIDSYLYRKKLVEDRLSGFDALEKGFDSVQIRIQYGCDLMKQDVLIITNRNNRWKAEICDLDYHFKDSEIPISIDIKKKPKSPTSGWETFINKIFNLKILTLEDGERIKRPDGCYPNDGCGATVEIATRNVYRLYRYINPNIRCTGNWQDQRIVDILTVINEELRITGMWPNEEYEWPIPKERPHIDETLYIKEIQIEPVSADSTRK